jgi:hypothetical protein
MNPTCIEFILKGGGGTCRPPHQLTEPTAVGGIEARVLAASKRHHGALKNVYNADLVKRPSMQAQVPLK